MTTKSAEIIEITKKAPTKAPKAKAPTKPKGKRPGGFARGTGYKDHRAGSRKEQAHRWFDDLGADKAAPKILASGIKQTTITSWFSFWRKQAAKK